MAASYTYWITVYTHVSDQFSAFRSRAIRCSGSLLAFPAGRPSAHDAVRLVPRRRGDGDDISVPLLIRSVGRPRAVSGEVYGEGG